MTSTPILENVRRYAAALDAILQIRWVDRLLLAVAIASFLAAIALGLIWTGQATAAAVSQRVRTERATKLTFNAQVREWRRHDTHGRSFRIRCFFANLRGHGPRRSGEPTDCTFRVYRRSNYRRLLAVIPFAVRVVPRQPDSGFEDGSGSRRYDARRSLEFDPMPRSQ